MKIVKGIVYFVLIMLAAVMLAALFAPAQKTVKREIVIDAPSSVIFNQLANFEKWKNWDAWYAKDTLQERTYYGVLNDKKHGYTWSSKNKDIGKGKVEMNEVKGTERLDYTFYFDGRPNKGSFQLMEEGEKTRVLWELYSDLDYPFKLMNYFIDPLVGSDFENGLQNLKMVAENLPIAQIDNGAIQIINELGVNYVIIKAIDLPMSEVDDFLKASYPKIYGYMSTNGLTIKGSPRGMYYKWDKKAGIVSLAAAVPLSKVDASAEKYTILSTGKAQITDQYISQKSVGGIQTNFTVHLALDKWISTERKRLRSPIIEEYIIGPLETLDTSLHETKIYYYFD